jgi:5'-3' exonuclease
MEYEMILVDLNQVLISNLMQQINSDPKMKIEENLVRHIVLNSLRSYSKQFKSKFGDIVICCDSKKYWRRDIFPFYKIHRRKDREKSDFDWNLIFETLNKIRDELKLYFPYRVLEVEGAEADDIIGVLAGRFAPHEDVLILSSDKDFVQLQKYENVQQYSPILKRFIKTDNPKMYIREHIIKGDRGDGVPNFLSPDNVFVVGERQKNINKKKLSEWIRTDPESFCTTDLMKKGYKRNQMLVDLDYIPEELKSKIVSAYDTTKPNSRMNMLNYMAEKKLKNLIAIADEF